MSASSCRFDGNSDMYGLGIRIGFYLTWFADILGPWVRRSEVPGTRVTITVFIAATFLALLIQTVKDSSQLRPVEVYVILLLTFGQYLSFVPIYAWRVFLRCEPYFDPSRYPRVKMEKDYSFFSFLLIAAVSGYEIWFWANQVPKLNGNLCTEYGFLFAKIRLNEKGFEVVNVIFHIFVLLACVVIFFITIGCIEVIPKDDEPEISDSHRDSMQLLHTIMRLIITSIVITATELTISWNHIQGVNSAESAGQIIPLVIGAVALVRLFYLRLLEPYPWFNVEDDISVNESVGGFGDLPMAREHRRRRRRSG